MKVQKYIEIRLLKKQLPPVIDVVQYDTGVQLVFYLVDFDIPSGTTAKLYVQKRSGKFVYQEEDITVTDDTITIDLENQALTEHGETKYQIMLTNGEDTITTFAGVLRIEASLADANAVESETVIRAFDEAVVDHVAEFQTKAEQIVAACIATIPDDYTTMEAKVNESANAVKGNLSGAVVFADDVSPVGHNPVVKVHGKNLVPYGTITFTKNKSYLLDNPLPAGTYTISALITSNDTDSEYSAVSINNKSEVLKYIALKRDKRFFFTFTVSKPITNIDFCAAYNYSQGETDSATWADIQVEQGEVATDYEPYIDPSTVSVMASGKNLFPQQTAKTVNGVTMTVYGNTCVLNGTATADAAFSCSLALPIQTYTFSLNNEQVVGSTVTDCPYYAFRDENSHWLTSKVASQLASTLTFAPSAKIKSFLFAVPAGVTLSSYRIKPQVEIGNVATNHEEVKGIATYIPASDGTVSGLTSLSPNMTILTDTEGAIVECEYNRDTNKVIEKLTNAIIALGGTV